MPFHRWLAVPFLLAGCGGSSTEPGPGIAITSGRCESGYGSVGDSAVRAINRAEGWSAGVLVAVNGVRWCEIYLGNVAAATTVATASAAKWLSAAAIMAMVDRGLLSLDDSVGRYLTGVTGRPATIRLRQLLSHTAGLPQYDNCMFDQSQALQVCARTILAATPIGPPGVVLSSPRGSLGYALGSWVDAEAGGLATISSSPGSRGFVPLIDWNRKIVVVVEAFDYLERVWAFFLAVWGEVDRLTH